MSRGAETERVGRYLLERKLAEGGMAEVYLAWQEGPGDFRRRCVVKRLLSHFQSSLKAAEMFLDEARITAQLNHPNIVQLYDFGVEGRNYYIALEYVEGCSVRSLLRHFAEKKARPPLAISLQIAIDVAQALSFAHRALGPDERPMSLIHRDISPRNVLISAAGCVKLIDFGVAKSTLDKHASTRGVVKGNVAYMSPEQIRSEPLDGRSDIFSLGVVLFELLSGRRAFQSSDDVVTLRNILEGRRGNLSELQPPIDKALVAIVDKALETDRAHRFPIAGELERALEDFAFAQRLRANPTTLSHVVNQVRTEGGERVTGAIAVPRDSHAAETVRGLPDDTAVARRRTPPRPKSSR